MFLSGGLSELDSTLYLNAMNQSPNPWHVSFSYARALQNTVLKTWAGMSAKKDEAQAILPAAPRRTAWRSLASSLLATSPTLSLSPPSRRTTSVRFFPLHELSFTPVNHSSVCLS